MDLKQQNIRQEHELPESIEKWGWKYHHIGIPTNIKMPNEKYIPKFKFYVSGFSTSPFGVEWMRFEHDSAFDKLIKTVPHIAFEVNDLDYELANRNFNILTEPNPPADGIRVAMIEHNGIPIELIEFDNNYKQQHMENEIDLEKARQSCIDYYDKAHKDYLNDFSDELIKKPYDKEFLEHFALLFDEKPKILDIGCCSSAQQARFFLDKGFRVTCIDLSEQCIKTAKENFLDIDFKQMDMTEMDFKEKSFDAINAFYSIIHIPDEKLSGLFNDFNRILKQNGLIAISVHTGDFYGYFEENGIPVFYRTYSKSDLEKLLDNSGFKIIKIDQREPIYDFEFQSERIYLIAEKKRNSY